MLFQVIFELFGAAFQVVEDIFALPHSLGKAVFVEEGHHEVWVVVVGPVAVTDVKQHQTHPAIELLECLSILSVFADSVVIKAQFTVVVLDPQVTQVDDLLLSHLHILNQALHRLWVLFSGNDEGRAATLTDFVHLLIKFFGVLHSVEAH